jgi:hypothetical protein
MVKLYSLTGCGSLWVCETSRLTDFLGNQLTDGCIMGDPDVSGNLDNREKCNLRARIPDRGKAMEEEEEEERRRERHRKY